MGVAAPAFGGIDIDRRADVYVPMGSNLGHTDWVRVLGRLRAGVSADRAAEALTPAFTAAVAVSDVPQIEREQHMARLLVTPAARGLSETRIRLGGYGWMLLTIVGVAFIMSGANLAGLVLARHSSRLERDRCSAGAWRTDARARYALRAREHPGDNRRRCRRHPTVRVEPIDSRGDVWDRTWPGHSLLVDRRSARRRCRPADAVRDRSRRHHTRGGSSQAQLTPLRSPADEPPRNDSQQGCKRRS